MWPVQPQVTPAELSAMSSVCQLSPSRSHDSVAASLTPVSPRRSAGYTQKRLTENLKVPYYVGEHFSKEFTGVILRNLEKTVEDDYISSLRNNCWKEKQQSMQWVSNRFYQFSGWQLKTDCVFTVVSCLASCRGGHAVPSSLFWRRRSVPEGPASSHAELRQAVWDHGFAKRMRLLRPKQVFLRLNPSSWRFCLQYLSIIFDWMSCFFVCFLPGLLSQHKTSPAVNRRALTMWRFKDDSSSNTNKPAATCIELTGWAKLQLWNMKWKSDLVNIMT